MTVNGSKISSCRSCSAAIVWARSARTGKPMPLDAVESIHGTLALVGRSIGDGAPLALVLREIDLEAIREQGAVVLYRSHFASCPYAAAWRRPRTRQEATA